MRLIVLSVIIHTNSCYADEVEEVLRQTIYEAVDEKLSGKLDHYRVERTRSE